MGDRRRWVRRLAGLVAAMGTLGIVAAAGVYGWFVVLHPGEHLAEDAILASISQESPVLYRDGERRVGVFFADQHRQYVPFAEIPPAFVDGLVSAEDQTFYEHYGFSIKGISRAMVANAKAGRVVEGGSTLTQQTAKNLFKRRSRTLKEKLRELLNGLRLEKHYTKDRILEFYSNQFYVNGNGRGLGIAARFFFDKEPRELDLLECAFLAGVVKGPARYTPWVAGRDKQVRARERSLERVEYVLGRMVDEGKLGAAERDEAVAEARAIIPLPEDPSVEPGFFSRGHFRYDRSVVLDEVERELSQPHFQRILQDAGVLDLGTTGLRITTTVDADAQAGALYGLRHHLTESGILLEAPKLGELFVDATGLKPVDRDRIQPRTFHRGVLTAVDAEAGTATLDLGGVNGVVDRAGNTRLAELRKRARDKNTWARAGRKDVAALLADLEDHIGSSTVVSIRSLDGQPTLDWEWRPKLQGAVVVLEEGELRAMVGGSANSDFNRATAARRQLGSTWKLLLFEAALQLGWSALDPLDNRRAVFPYQATFYYPRPDHKGAPEEVSMLWAATKSENLASIWLLYHLCDRLNPEQLRHIAAQVDLVPRSGESVDAWVKRVQTEGVLPTDAKQKAAAFERAREDLLVDLAFDGRDDVADALRRIRYGLGFGAEADRLAADSSLPAGEKATRQGTLRRTLLRQEALAPGALEARDELLRKLDAGAAVDDEDTEGFAVRWRSGRPKVSFGEFHGDDWEALDAAGLQALLRIAGTLSADEEVGFAPDAPDAPDGGPSGDGAAAVDPDEAFAPDAQTEDAVDRAFAGDDDDSAEPAVEEPPSPDIARTLFADEELLLEGLLTPALVAVARASTDAAAAARTGGLYEWDNLAQTRDFRVLIAIRYVEALARRSGVQSPIAAVMSMPLGSSDITLLEAAAMYQVMLTGQTYRFFGDPLAADPTLHIGEPGEGEVLPTRGLIAEIALPDGRVLYRASKNATEVTSTPVRGELASMLRAVVEHGTGRRANGVVAPISGDPARQAELSEFDLSVPLFGKTGTTNSYKNSAFVGQVPGLPRDGDQLTWGHGHVIATYVGYDDNTEMRRGGIRLAGASGSLPTWIAAARAAVESSDIGDRVSLADVAFSGGGTLPVAWPDGFVGAAIDPRTGLRVEGEVDGVLTVRVRSDERSFAPFAPLPGARP